MSIINDAVNAIKDILTDHPKYNEIEAKLDEIIKYQNEHATPTPTPPVPPTPTPPAPNPNPVPPTPSSNPFVGAELYVNPNGVVAQFVANNPNDPNIDLLKKISTQPTGMWLTGGTEAGVYKQVSDVLKDAVGKLVTFVVYNIPNRDNGGQSSGGAATPSAYYAWCGSIDSAIKDAGNPKVVLILEPDAMGFALQEDTQGKYKRFEMLKIANDILTQNPNRFVYLDIAMWNPDTQPMADAIKASMIKNLRGFALNVSGYNALGACTQFGDSLTAQTGLPYIVDTGRNGNGGILGQWENLTGQALGLKPLSLINVAHTDANLWIKPSGESDGADNGAPPAGELFYDRAVELAKNSKW